MAEEFVDIEGRRYYWDGRIYSDPEEAERASLAYRSEGFSVQEVQGDGGTLLYTRREALQ